MSCSFEFAPPFRTTDEDNLGFSGCAIDGELELAGRLIPWVVALAMFVLGRIWVDGDVENGNVIGRTADGNLVGFVGYNDAGPY